MEHAIKILIVDDDPDVITLTKILLEREGYLTGQAENGSDAMVQLDEFEPDLVLLDMNLPDMSGLEVLTYIKTSPVHKHCFVIINTGHETSSDHVARGLEAGADDYLIKPSSRHELLARIHALVRLKKTENELRQAKLSLEKLVDKKIEQLSFANEQLIQEIHERKVAQQQLFKKIQDFNAISLLGKQVASNLLMDKVLSQIYEQVSAILEVDMVLIYLVKENQLILPETTNCFKGLSVKQPKFKSVGHCLCGMVAQNQKPIYSADLKKDDRCTRSDCREAGITSFAAIPLLAGGDVIGVLGAGTRRKADLSRNSVLFETVGNQVSIALFNAMIYDELLATNETLQAQQKESLQKQWHLNTVQDIAKIASFESTVPEADLTLSRNFPAFFGHAGNAVDFSFERIQSHIHARDIERFQQDYEKFSTHKTGIDNEYRIVCEDGTIKDTRLIMGWHLSHDSEKIFGIFQDITDKKRLERQIIQNEKLASLGFLVSGVAHEINNPNNFITFNLPILREYLEAVFPIVDNYAQQNENFEIFNMAYPEFKDDVFKLLTNVDHGANRINRIVSNLREFVHMKNNVELEWVNVSTLLEKCVEICRGKINKLVRSFECNIQDDLPMIYTDAEVLEISIINLLINAAQASDKTDSYVRLDIHESRELPDYFIFRISDNGCGMSDNTMKRIFEPFFSTKSSKEGTGIGLSLCHNLVSSVEGKIDVNSTLGVGTEFTITLPSLKQADMESHPSIH